MTSERPPESAGGSQRSRSASGERLRLYCRSRGADGGPEAAQGRGGQGGAWVPVRGAECTRGAGAGPPPGRQEKQGREGQSGRRERGRSSRDWVDDGGRGTGGIVAWGLSGRRVEGTASEGTGMDERQWVVGASG